LNIEYIMLNKQCINSQDQKVSVEPKRRAARDSSFLVIAASSVQFVTLLSTPASATALCVDDFRFKSQRRQFAAWSTDPVSANERGQPKAGNTAALVKPWQMSTFSTREAAKLLGLDATTLSRYREIDWLLFCTAFFGDLANDESTPENVRPFAARMRTQACPNLMVSTWCP
jgi:hypothetical protein